MLCVKTKADLKQQLQKADGRRGLVMTMGALHDGHLELVKACAKECDYLVVSIYVNPLQFGPNEDFSAYPRQLEADLALLEPLGVDLVFAPTDTEMYPNWPALPLVSINPGPIASLYEGAQRPGHFAGVLQVVNKVFQLVAPEITFFGQKDAQQLALVRTMVRDLDMPIKVKALPVQRDKDGLALSSRNAYLTAQERQIALSINQALKTGYSVANAGGSPSEIIAACRQVIVNKNLSPDYVILVDPITFERLDDYHSNSKQQAVIAIACLVGKTRLLDNMLITVGRGSHS